MQLMIFVFMLKVNPAAHLSVLRKSFSFLSILRKNCHNCEGFPGAIHMGYQKKLYFPPTAFGFGVILMMVFSLDRDVCVVCL